MATSFWILHIMMWCMCSFVVSRYPNVSFLVGITTSWAIWVFDFISVPILWWFIIWMIGWIVFKVSNVALFAFAFIGKPIIPNCLPNHSTGNSANYSSSNSPRRSTNCTTSHSSCSSRTQPIRINPINRIITDISMKINPTPQPNRISRNIPPYLRIIKPMPIIIQPSLTIKVLSRKPIAASFQECEPLLLRPHNHPLRSIKHIETSGSGITDESHSGPPGNGQSQG